MKRSLALNSKLIRDGLRCIAFLSHHILESSTKSEVINWEPKKTALITFVTDTIEEVDEWYEKLKRHGVKLLTEPKTHEDIGVRGFFLQDPAGYSIEIQYFL